MALLTGQQVRDLGYNPDTVSSVSNGMYDISQFKGGAPSPNVQSTVAPGSVSNAPLPVAPKEGFKQGGWYDARQYWDGQFGQPGVVMNPAESGYGKMVSADVVSQTDPRNQAYINSLYGGTANAGTPGAGTPSVSGAGTTNADLDAIDKELKAVQDQIASKTAEANKRMVENNANPFLSEANRMGGEQKIRTALENSLLADQQNIANIQARRKAKEDAIAANKPNLDIQYQTDDAGNVNVITVDKNTGNIISTKSAGKVGKATKGDTNTPTEVKAANLALLNQTMAQNTNWSGHVEPAIFNAVMDAYVQDGIGTQQDFLSKYKNNLDPNRTDWGSEPGYHITKEQKDALLKASSTSTFVPGIYTTAQ